jgi:CRISPR-associated protein Csx3
MVHAFPAVLIGGPPCAGKSVLFYQITQALRERGVPHHAIRACPDGEGNWYHEGDPNTVSHIRVKRNPWPPEFVQRMCEDLRHRCLPFLVDVGGCPQSSDLALFRLCTHSILLLRADKPESAQLWRQMVEKSDLYPLALLSSQQAGDSVITRNCLPCWKE